MYTSSQAEPDMGVPLPDYLLRIAQQDIDKEIILIIHESTSESDGAIASVTWRQLLDDVDRKSSALTQISGLKPRNPGDEPVTVGLLAQNGYDYFVDLAAMILLRWTVLLISPRNSPDAVEHLLLSTGSRRLFADESHKHILDDTTFPLITIPLSNHDTSTSENMNYTSYLGSYTGFHEPVCSGLSIEAENACLILHTSGSTGHPKPVPWTHSFIMSLTKATAHDRQSRRGTVIYTPLPLCHGGGIGLCLPNIIGTESIFTFISSHKPITSEAVISHTSMLKDKDFDVFLPPSILEDMFDSNGVVREELLKILRYPNAVVWGGAPLTQRVGEYLSNNGIRLVAWGGITEVGVFARSVWNAEYDASDWPYFRLTDCFDFIFKPLDAADLRLGYTLTISSGYATPAVVNSSNPEGFLTSDLWQQHPDPLKSNLWRIIGRLDDVTVLSNGEKTNNRQLENLLCESPLISSALIFGSGKFLNGAVILPTQSLEGDFEELMANFPDLIWPHINDHVNRIVPQHSRLIRPLVIVAKPGKPFLFSDKKTVKREATLDLYREEIATAYERVEFGDANDQGTERQLPTKEQTIELICRLVTNVLGNRVGVDQDLFEAGLESLQATRLRFELSSALNGLANFATLERNVIYSYPTIKSLAHFIVSRNDRSGSHSGGISGKETHDIIDIMIKKYSSCIPKHRSERLLLIHEDETYAVTGTTGSLGASLVSTLLHKQKVKKIYLLNRENTTTTIQQRHKAIFGEKGFDYDELAAAVSAGKAVYITVDYGDSRLGLSDDTYKKLASEATHIVHIAWRVSLNLVLSSFETQIAGLRHIIDLALSTKRQAPPFVTFMSSIAVVGQWPYAHAPRETTLPSSDFVLPYGYAYAKYVSEKILEVAAQGQSGLRALIVRCGQISGAFSTGAWSRNEYFPTLMRMSNKLGLIPEDLPTSRWLPVNVAAEVLFKLTQHASTSAERKPLSFFHMENNVDLPWSAVVSAMRTFRDGKEIQSIPLHRWLEYAANSEDDTLVHFIDRIFVQKPMPRLDTSEANLAAADSLCCMINDDLLERYVQYACRET